MRECSCSDVAVTKVSLPLPRDWLTDWLSSPFSHAHSPTRHSLTPPPPLAFLVMRCRWAETRPHVSAGFAASPAPIISSLPWHRAQRQLTARHLTAASHAWTPDTVTAWPNQIRSLVSVDTIQSQMCVFTNRLTGKLPGRELASSSDHCLLLPARCVLPLWVGARESRFCVCCVASPNCPD